MTSASPCAGGAAAAPSAACAGGGAGAKRSRRRAVLFTTASALACAAAPLRAQSWPAKPIRLILTAPPGSSIDVLGRLIAEQLRERLGQPVVAENRAQAGGTAGTDAVAKAPPDGYTIGLSFTGPLATAPFLYAKLPYDPARDLAPIVLVGTAPNVLAVTSGLPVHSFAEWLAYVRARPGQLNYASVGNGSASHLAMELLKTAAGLFIVHIPFNGAPPAVQATAAGDVQMIMSNPTSLLPMIQAGRIRPLAVTSASRWPQMKNLPTIAEGGFPGYEAIAWNGVVAPAGTPRNAIARLNREINAILNSPLVRPKIDAAGWDIAGGSPEAFAAFMEFERQRWQPVIKRSGARLD
jgi:tripartite-type tricarboxylate transporter receptor subunit TctC